MASIVSDGNISINSTTVPKVQPFNINIRRLFIDKENVATQVGDFEPAPSNVITLYGNYPQNSVDIPIYDLSTIVSLDTNIANFNFILSIKDGDEEPKLFCNKDVMIDLIAKYGNSNPIPVNYLINERKIVLIDLEPLNLLTEQMIATELSINLNNNKNVEVRRNLFTYTNYASDSDGNLVANPSYDLNELIKYISWVVNKPNQNYDERLLASNVIGDWVNPMHMERNTLTSWTETSTEEDEPSTDTTNIPDTDTTNIPNTSTTGSGNPVLDAAALAIISRLEAAETTARNFYNQKKSELDSLGKYSPRRITLGAQVAFANIALETAKAALKAAKQLYGLL